MASVVPSPLLAVLLVTSSSRGSTLSFRYPRRPVLEKRYSRVKYLVAAAAEDDDGRRGGDRNGEHFLEDEMDEEADALSSLSEDLDGSERSDSSSSEGGDDDDQTEIVGNGDEEPGTSDFALSSRHDAIEVASSAGGTAATGDAAAASAAVEKAKRRQRAYQQYLGYDCELLASLLAPKRELCHQKFELVVDDLAFVGHPVCVDKDGKWDPEAGTAVDEDAFRGRDTARRGDAAGREGEEAANVSARTTLSPQMTLFHLVLVLDRPDPSPDLPALDLTSWLQIFYDNVAFKMTAALFAEEVRESYVSRECEKISHLRERCMDDGQSYASFLTLAVHSSTLARCIERVHSSISLSSNAFVTINDSIDAHLQLPPLIHNPARLMKMADIETPIDLNDALFAEGKNATMVKQLLDSDGLMYEELNRTTGPFLMPWKTLLVLHEDHTHHAGRDGQGGLEEQADGASFASASNDKGVEAWAQKFTSLLKPTLEGMPTLADMADLLEWDLEEDVYPMVRHLIYYREARVIDVPRIQNYYSVSPLFDLFDLPKLSTSWSIRFPVLSPLPAFLASLSSALRPFSTLVRRRDQRIVCLDALIWLLKHDVICQMHVRLRLIASEACKFRAATARKNERIRIKQKRERRAAQIGRHRQTTAAFTAAEVGHSAPVGEAERGRMRDRIEDGDMGHAGAAKMAPPSALSATRPDTAGELASLSPPAILSRVKVDAVAQLSEELRFERRPVLRSRSPSRLLASVGERASSIGMTSTALAATSYGTRGSGSRPSTPRGRVRVLGHDGGGRPVTGESFTHKKVTTKAAQQGRAPSSVPSAPVSIEAQLEAAGVGKNRRRSPSVARLRVKGFGDGEEVYVEEKSAPDTSEDGATRITGSHDSRKRGLLAMHDEMRRLSLVGEEKDGTMNRKDTESTSQVSSGIAAGPEQVGGEEEGEEGEEEEEEEEEEELLQYDIEYELWESHPVATIIAEPSRASGDENEWIAAMVEGREPWLVERMYRLLPFLNGKHTVDEIVYRLEWRRKDLRAVLNAFRDDIVTFVHP